ncbi:helix-turn-helix domain-containing protein [Reichenbachiella versicolor]|uniref:helix-turn-helix domain-containing protein n=1 Tax=Reichenbachiella versicolor TaxID=1821036 RepID=UPI001C87D8FA|nr:AraC family transcriptional regulator [Reichenbachiella versicolor]
MKTITLPEALSSFDETDIQVHDYHAQAESTKQQVDLSMNTFSFLQEGYKEVHSDVKSIAISNDDFLLMKAGKCLMTEKLTGVNNTYRSILLFFSSDLVSQFIKKYSISVSNNTPRKTVQSIPYDGYLRSYAESLTDLSHLSPSNRNRILQVKFEELMLYLLDKFGADFFNSLKVKNDAEAHFKEVIENNKLNKLTLSELAFLCNMSLSTFKRTFEKHFQLPPSKWFQEKRLEYAAYLLKNDEKRASDIYLEIGYESLTNFVKAFKAKYNVTPKQYQSG